MHVDAIKFNHDPNNATQDALTIRKNAGQSVIVPEWQRGVSLNPEDSPAAYAIEQTSGNQLTIQVRFRRTDSTMDTAEVRAVDPTLEWHRGPQGCLYWFLTKLGIKVDPGPPTHLNVLGEVKAREISFHPNGLTDFLTFQLERVGIWSRGVGIDNTVWQWQYRPSGDHPWYNLTPRTLHRIYTVLSTPSSPWTQIPSSALNLPWTEVLDYACRWAEDAKNADIAACAITREVYNLGPSVLEYDCPGGGATHYAWPDFDCSEFLELLQGGLGWGRYVNCTDCATIVSTFANILGCELWQSRMGWSFGLNPILAIGSNVWQPACNWPGFSYHEVAWKGACTVNDGVFDACLQVDGDDDPTAPPHTPVLPCNMRFGNTGDGDYRDRLASPAGRPNCNPQSTTRQRRDIS